MNKNEQLDELFIKWRKVLPVYKKNFHADGIINESLFEKNNNPKILFLCKEANIKNHKGIYQRDFRSEWNKEGATYPFAYRIAEWSHGILNDFPLFDNIYNLGKWHKPYQDALNEIAFMNVKKNAGGGMSEDKKMIKSVSFAKNNYLILEQIKIINPKIIILGLSWPHLRDAIFKNAIWMNSGYGLGITKWNNSKVIDFYHPSSRNAPAAAYSLLQNVIRSEAFINL